MYAISSLLSIKKFKMGPKIISRYWMKVSVVPKMPFCMVELSHPSAGNSINLF